MRGAMFFPNRILYREELLSTTVTYAVDLDETEFWTLKPIVPIEQLGIRPAEFRLNEVADKILERYAIHELHYLASVNADIARVRILLRIGITGRLDTSRSGVFVPVPMAEVPQTPDTSPSIFAGTSGARILQRNTTSLSQARTRHTPSRLAHPNAYWVLTDRNGRLIKENRPVKIDRGLYFICYEKKAR